MSEQRVADPLASSTSSAHSPTGSRLSSSSRGTSLQQSTSSPAETPHSHEDDGSDEDGEQGSSGDDFDESNKATDDSEAHARQSIPIVETAVSSEPPRQGSEAGVVANSWGPAAPPTSFSRSIEAQPALTLQSSSTPTGDAIGDLSNTLVKKRAARPDVWVCFICRTQRYRKSSGRSIRKHVLVCYRARHPQDTAGMDDDALNQMIASQQDGGLETGLRTWRYRKKRRAPEELPEKARWTCPLGCGKVYRLTSAASIQAHRCADVINKGVEDGALSYMTPGMSLHPHALGMHQHPYMSFMQGASNGAYDHLSMYSSSMGHPHPYAMMPPPGAMPYPPVGAGLESRTVPHHMHAPVDPLGLSMHRYSYPPQADADSRTPSGNPPFSYPPPTATVGAAAGANPSLTMMQSNLNAALASAAMGGPMQPMYGMPSMPPAMDAAGAYSYGYGFYQHFNAAMNQGLGERPMPTNYYPFAGGPPSTTTRTQSPSQQDAPPAPESSSASAPPAVDVAAAAPPSPRE